MCISWCANQMVTGLVKYIIQDRMCIVRAVNSEVLVRRKYICPFLFFQGAPMQLGFPHKTVMTAINNLLIRIKI